MDRVAARPEPPPEQPAEPPAPTPASTGRTPPSGGGRRRRAAGDGQPARRLSVDLEPELHRSLRIYAMDHRCDGTEVVRALLELLAEDPIVAAAVADRLRA